MNEVTLPPLGTLLADKYRLDREIGRGGMGIVYAAHHETLGQHVAVKLLAVPGHAPPTVVDRFLREARAVVRLRSEHVVRVYDVGSLPGGIHYLVMDLLDGEDLMHRIQTRGVLPIEEAVDLLVQACAGLSEAHTAGVVHRDVKLGNLFVTRRRDGSSCLKVLDFGISKVTQGIDSDLDLTETAALLGSPMYMAPEQIKNAKTVDARADLWALGVVAHRLLTGHPPFAGDSPMAICAAISADPPADVRARRPEVPAGLSAVIGACLEKDPGRRPATAAMLALALAPFGSAETRALATRLARETDTPIPTIPAVPAPPGEARAEPSSAAGAAERPAPTVKRRALSAWLLVGAAGLAVGGLIAVVVTSHAGRSSGPPAESAPASTTTSKPSVATSATEAASSGTATKVADSASALPPRPSASASSSVVAVPKKPPPASTGAGWGSLIEEAK